MALPYQLITFDCEGTLVLDGAVDESVSEALRTLGNKAPLGIVTDHDRAGMLRAIEALRVPVSLAVSREDAGSRKPAPGHWETVLARTGLSPDTILHVASSVERDLRPAAALGFRVAHLRGDGPPAPPDLDPAHEARDLGQLVHQILALDLGISYDPAYEDMPLPKEHLEGVRLFNRRDYYEAHEVWEEAWKQDRSGSANYFKGLLQFAVATLHWERGNAAGARRLYQEARGLLTPYVPEHLGLDVVDFLQRMEDYFEPFFDALRRGETPPAPKVGEPPQIELRC